MRPPRDIKGCCAADRPPMVREGIPWRGGSRDHEGSEPALRGAFGTRALGLSPLSPLQRPPRTPQENLTFCTHPLVLWMFDDR